ncbi:MAG: Rieske (2Fe-2S) protein [Polyangiaceae bacterium]|nr:Rieske (2Fe-2S) protein [Polyangiaceae bacterium]
MAQFILSSAPPEKDGETITFELFENERPRQGFILRRNGELLAFLNECPHWSVDLDLGDEDFYDQKIDRIYCKNHGALFVLPDGECETGPCLGRKLIRFEVQANQDDLRILLPPPYSTSATSRDKNGAR